MTSFRIFPYWLLLVLFAGARTFGEATDVVINEIHYNPDKQGEAEFIELYNRGTTALDVSFWELDGAVRFLIPPIVLTPGAFLVIAENPDDLLSEFGQTAVGPWEGQLSNDGEEVILRNKRGVEVDRVDYRPGFPWPTAADGEGQSMELLNPELDNDLAGSWRSSRSPGFLPKLTLVARGSGRWSWRPGTEEASSVAGAWRERNFVEDHSWAEADLPIGFGSVTGMAFATPVSGMQNIYRSIFLRREWTIAPGEVPSALELHYLLDDGLIVWINGVEVLRENLPDGELTVDDTASGNYAEGTWKTEMLENSDYLLEGRNVLCAQVFNARIGSSDLGLDLELVRAESGVEGTPTPTPGKRNSVYTENAPPQIRQVRHSPAQPAHGEDLVITAKITDLDGMGEVFLEYQAVEPGHYIRLDDSEYDSSWVSLAMRDDGSAGDVAAGDATFSVTLPGSLQKHRWLTRYRIRAGDSLRNEVVVPYRDDPSPNFAFFTYNGVPSWTGSTLPGQAPPTDFDEGLMNSLPTCHLLTRASDVISCQYDPAFNDKVYRWEGALVYDGVVYDHIHYRIRGSASTYNTGKNKWKLRFNRGHYFQGSDDYGRPYREKVRTLNWSALASPWNPGNRGMAGLDEALAFRLWERANTISRKSNYFHLRVIDGEAEQSPSNQFVGDNWGLYLAIDQADRRFLDERGLPDGNTFNMHFGNSNLINEAADQPHDRSDLFRFVGTGPEGYNRVPIQPVSWWESHVELDSYFSYRAVVEAINHSDLRDRENSNLYHNPVTGKWTMIPWDCDLLYETFDRWGPNGVENGTLEQFRKCLVHPELQIRFQNRVRELQDLLFNRDQGWSQVDELVGILGGTDRAGWPELDAARWNKDPRSRKIEGRGGNSDMLFFMNPYYSTRYPPNGRTLVSADFPGMVDWVKEFIIPSGFGGGRLRELAKDPKIPATPTISYDGDPGFPTSGLGFQASDYVAGSEGSDFEAIEWRVGEIYRPGVSGYVDGDPYRYEVDSFWTSGPLNVSGEPFEVPAIAVREGRSYRARVRHQGQDGRWSHWSEPVEFIASVPLIDPYLDHLVISEVMYKPVGGSELEFIELTNTGSRPLDLSEVRFTKGVDFDFLGSAITVIEPGAYVLVVKNQEAFEAHYGGGLPVAGEYQFSSSNSLSNGGERLKLSYGAGSAIRDFVYGDELPWSTAADDSGHSLVLMNPGGNVDHAVALNWRSSAMPGGSPGGSDVLPEFSGNPQEDADGDGVVALLEYVLGGDDLDRKNTPRLMLSVEAVERDGVNANYVYLSLQRALGADQFRIALEASEDLESWRPAEGEMVLIQEKANGDGTSILQFRSTLPVNAVSSQAFRIRVGPR